MPGTARKNKHVSANSKQRQRSDVAGVIAKPNVDPPWRALLSNQEHISVEERLHDEIVAYTSYMSPTPEESLAVHSVESKVRKILERPFRECQVHVFGSTATGLRLPDSDIDLVIETNDSFDTKSILFRLSHMLKSEDLTRDVFVNFLARIPILSFTTVPHFGSMKFDVGINNANGLETGNFVTNCLRNMPALRPLVLVIKRALAQHDLNDAARSGISSFAAICMCISFLQLNPGKRPPEWLDDPLGHKALGYLLIDFLSYYSQHFPYKSMFISVSQSCLVSKDSARWITDPYESRLVIQCPCDPVRDLTKSLSRKRQESMKLLFKQAYQKITHSTTSSRDILSILVSVNTKFIEHRARVRSLIQSGLPADNSVTEDGTSHKLNSGLSCAALKPVPSEKSCITDHTKVPSGSSRKKRSRRVQHWADAL